VFLAILSVHLIGDTIFCMQVLSGANIMKQNGDCDQGCQMVYFKTKKPNVGIF
jgi:hypothetical protein